MSTSERSKRVLHRGRAADDRREQAIESTSEQVAGATPSAIAREQMVAVAAYYRALRRNFEPGHELEDWLEAEAEVEATLPAA